VSGRSLAYLNTIPIDEVKGLTGKRGQALRRAGIISVSDLLLHTPRRYLDRSTVTPIGELSGSEEVTVMGRVRKVSLRRPRRNLSIVEADIADETGSIRCVWFNQPFRANQLKEGTEAAISGKFETRKGRRQMNSPAVDLFTSDLESLVTGRVVPIHPSTGEVGPGHMRRAVHNALLRSRPILDPLPKDLVSRMKLLERDQAIANMHFPDSMDDVPPARRRLVFDELFRLEVALALNKRRMIDEAQGFSHGIDPEGLRRYLSVISTRMKLDLLAAGELEARVAREVQESINVDIASSLDAAVVDALTDDGSLQPATAMSRAFADTLPFPPTNAQILAIFEILGDLAVAHPMHRLLQGEVGSGKTLVAVFALLAAVGSGFQAAVMAPTEVLAEQHFLGIAALIEAAGMTPPVMSSDELGMESLFTEEPGEHRVSIALLTASHAEVNFRPRGTTNRDDLLAWIADGRVDVVVGTHALIQEGVHFAGLGLAVVDEQHRFGVAQRVMLKEKAVDVDPDLLIMTATPIPRTLSMTLYGDLDVSVLDEMPPGRTPVATRAVDPAALGAVYEEVREQVAAGRQVFYVCPLVEESLKIEAASATAEYDRLQAVFPDLRLGLLHGQMPSKDKEATMRAFRAAEIDILVATTVIEVGIDIPNATMMVIQDADRFGLSQLHQLRGRVGRGAHVSSCILVADPTTDEGEARIAAMVATNDGFRLAEEDLRIRGQGTVFGTRQSGMADLRLADILRDTETLIAARREAFELVGDDPDLSAHPDIKDEIREMLGDAVDWLFVS
jgi:ATP-dependent DNA helicase RecG